MAAKQHRPERGHRGGAGLRPCDTGRPGGAVPLRGQQQARERHQQRRHPDCQPRHHVPSACSRPQHRADAGRGDVQRARFGSVRNHRRELQNRRSLCRQRGVRTGSERGLPDDIVHDPGRDAHADRQQCPGRRGHAQCRLAQRLDSVRCDGFHDPGRGQPAAERRRWIRQRRRRGAGKRRRRRDGGRAAIRLAEAHGRLRCARAGGPIRLDRCVCQGGLDGARGFERGEPVCGGAGHPGGGGLRLHGSKRAGGRGEWIGLLRRELSGDLDAPEAVGEPVHRVCRL